MSIGFDRPLYLLPFDHRESFKNGMFGWKGPLTDDQTAQIAAAKQIVYEGFTTAIAGGVPKERAGILVDEQFGAAILRQASAHGYITACPAEKSGQIEFDFEYGADFAAHIELFQPTFSKVLVRYNPLGDTVLNKRQSKRLRQLSDYLRKSSRSLFMFELLVPPEQSQLELVHSDRHTYDSQIRPRLMTGAIKQLQDAGVEPDIWKVEGLDRTEDCENVVAVARRNGRDAVGCIILGRGEDEKKVGEWLTIASQVPGFVGFAVGRTVFWQPLIDFRTNKITRNQAVLDIARRYSEFVDTFQFGKSRAA
jgi:5-dehydro-2-deoxygluconokinase